MSNYWTRDLTLQALQAGPGVQYNGNTGTFLSRVRAYPSMELDVIPQPGVRLLNPWPKLVVFGNRVNTGNPVTFYDDPNGAEVVASQNSIILNTTADDDNPVFTFIRNGSNEIIGFQLNEIGTYKMVYLLHAIIFQHDGTSSLSFGFRGQGDNYLAVGFCQKAPIMIETEFENIVAPRVYEFVYGTTEGDNATMQSLSDFDRDIAQYISHGYISKLT